MTIWHSFCTKLDKAHKVVVPMLRGRDDLTVLIILCPGKVLYLMFTLVLTIQIHSNLY